MFAKFQQTTVKRLISIILLVVGMRTVQPDHTVHALSVWYVATTGDNSNSCSTPDAPCATIQAAVDKATAGSKIYVASGVYTTLETGLFSYVIKLNKDLSLYGGWDPSFLEQTGITVIDGQQQAGGIISYGSIPNLTIVLDRFHIRNSPKSGIDFSSTNLTLTNSAIYNNSNMGYYKNGGGITGYYGDLNVMNSTISQNKTSGDGGGIRNYGGSLHLNNVTVTNNSASYGGGVGASTAGEPGEVRIDNSIIFGNKAVLDGQDCLMAPSFVNHTIIGKSYDCPISGGSDNLLDVDPKLGMFIEELGYQPLQYGSPAIDAGFECFGDTDQRGVPRVGNCDIGSYEFSFSGSGPSIALVTGDQQTTAPNSLFKLPLSVIVLDEDGHPLSGQEVTFASPESGASAVFVANQMHSITLSTGNDGIASVEIHANALSGNYSVTAETSLGTASFSLRNFAWYVSNDGNNANSCLSAQDPCSDINIAMNRAQGGDIVLVAAGTYMVGFYEVVSITKDITLEGGWDPAFTTQNGFSIVDAGNARRGISVGSYVTASMNRFIVQNGVSSVGGGIYNFGFALTINNSIIRDSAAELGGGGIYNHYGTLIVRNTLVHNNSTERNGGGMESYGPLFVEDSAVFNNTSLEQGGGIFAGPRIELNNVTIENNTAKRGGGLYPGSSTVLMNNVTVYNNHATSTGGGISTFGSSVTNIQMQNSILANNTSTSSPDCSGAIQSLGHNIVQSTLGCDIQLGNGDKFSVDPRVGDFIPSLGLRPLLPASPAIDSGNDLTCMAADQRGITRPQIAHCDIGAYEYQPEVDSTGVFRPSNGALYLKNKNESGFADVQINYGLGGDYPVVGDWDGDGTATIGVYRNGYFMLRNENTIGFAQVVFPFGMPGDQPVAGDWNGDGVDTIGVYRKGMFFLRNSNDVGSPDMVFGLGVPGDVGIAGDWDGDGIDTTGVFRPSNGALYLKYKNETGFADLQINYGLAGDKPVTGDWDNDGVDTIGVYRNGQFMLRNSNTIGYAEIVFGLGIPGDHPIAGNWDGLP